ncbi:MAG TPA: ATP-dependent 6-phosphofructokinase [Ktedonobacterales bacterium]|jgi:6-phosphofructokinase 1|nr:ATP-dependent 6-phosphofructokinase [Ktedonobacterales bacterium]
MTSPRKIALLTSGGDAPGDNSAIRSVVRVAGALGIETLGIEEGYSGLLDGNVVPMTSRTVAGIGSMGGSVLGNAREPRMRDASLVERAALRLREEHGVEALVVIGGNGSQAGAALLNHYLPVVGVASTIDNDLNCADVTIGVDTAANTAVEAIDRIKCTATSNKRLFAVEVMGRNCGYLAVKVALAAGVERVIVPEIPDNEEDVLRAAHEALHSGKRHFIIVVAEGASISGETLVKHAAEQSIDARFTRLGHIQRGGTPTAFDRELATRMGAAAIQALTNDEHGGVVMLARDKIQLIPFEEATQQSIKVARADVELVRMVS